MGRLRYSLLCVLFLLLLTACGGGEESGTVYSSDGAASVYTSSYEAGDDEGADDGRLPWPTGFDYSEVEPYSGNPYEYVNGGIPFFTEKEISEAQGEQYSALDALGRCGGCVALVGRETFPEAQRTGIGDIRPTGFVNEKYDWIDGHYVYNRCHLIGYQLTGQNDNPLNLITGTRYMNVEGMEIFERKTYHFVNDTGKHVLYRTTPVFGGDNLVAYGVLMEGRSLEDGGESLLFCVFCYNVQPGVIIDYATGETRADPEWIPYIPGDVDEENGEDPFTDHDVVIPEGVTYVGNRRRDSMKFHKTDCESVSSMMEHNMVFFYGERQEAIDAGYTPCGNCHP